MTDKDNFSDGNENHTINGRRRSASRGDAATRAKLGS
jgi:hypothetical protein